MAPELRPAGVAASAGNPGVIQFPALAYPERDSGPCSIAENLAAVQARVEAALARACRPAGSVLLVAVGKTFGPEAIREAYDAGQRHFGENRVQEFEGKRSHLQLEGAVWHLIGRLQSNKAARAAKLFDWIHTVDSTRLACRLDQAAAGSAGRLPVLIEVKLSAEPAKTGVPEEQVEELAAEIRRLERLELRGVMTMPPWSEDPEQSRPYFLRLREIGARLGTPELSMGMSNDFEAAIEEGATIVRVGTAIFGKRQPPR